MSFVATFLRGSFPGGRLAPPPDGTTRRKKEDYLQETPSYPIPRLFLRDKVLKGSRVKKQGQA
jgi:hypothetical protein